MCIFWCADAVRGFLWEAYNQLYNISFGSNTLFRLGYSGSDTARRRSGTFNKLLIDLYFLNTSSSSSYVHWDSSYAIRCVATEHVMGHPHRRRRRNALLYTSLYV